MEKGKRVEQMVDLVIGACRVGKDIHLLAFKMTFPS